MKKNLQFRFLNALFLEILFSVSSIFVSMLCFKNIILPIFLWNKLLNLVFSFFDKNTSALILTNLALFIYFTITITGLYFSSRLANYVCILILKENLKNCLTFKIPTG
jgi:integral membrane sensor domain MASE1